MCGLCLRTRRIPTVVACFLLGLLVLTNAIATWPSDTDALVAFKESLSAGVPASWTGDPCAGWQGVNCSDQGRVTRLIVDFQGLQGRIPAQLGNLLELTYMSLEANQLDGPIPPELGNLIKLTWLGLAQNSLTGSIPPQLGNLINVTYLSLRSNQLTGTIPAELGKMIAVDFLDLRVNNLSGPIPPQLGQLRNLEYLILQDNKLTGPIPEELGTLPILYMLYLDSNKLSGSIPPALGNLSTMVLLSLGDNNLTGTVPPQLAGCQSLIQMSLRSNHLTGSIPPELGSLSNLTYFGVFNNSLNGTIPLELTRLSLLEFLDLSANNLTGSIPPDFGNLSALTDLQLYSNSLTGSIPGSLGNFANLTNLLLYDNYLTEGLPPQLANLSKLQTLDAHNNNLNGSIPADFGRLSSLETLVLSSNRFEGAIPEELWLNRNLKTLDLSDNRFSGKISDQLGSFTALAAMNLSRNTLTGTIPKTLRALLTVTTLDLSRNNLSESIPLELGALLAVTILDLSHNSLTGPIPGQLSNLEGLNFLSLSQNSLTRVIPEGLGNLRAVVDLSHNKLWGPIPDNVMWDQESNLSDNYLNGRVPQRLANSSLALNCLALETGNVSTNRQRNSTECSNFNQEIALLSAPPPVSLSPAVSSSWDVKRTAIAVRTSLLVALLPALLFLFMLWRRRTHQRRRSQNRSFNIPDTAVKSVLLSDLKRATHNFNESHRIGKGGFGDVYKGHLAGTPVAIKKLKVGSHQGWDEFEKELTTIGSIHNRNLVKLLGYCVDGEELLLVYEFMANGSLQDALSAEGGVCLDWEQYKGIMVGTAYAIAYLHEGCSPRIIHRDIKPANILLDQNFEAKVSDFGLARTTSVEETHVSTAVKGTPWYLAPEYVTTGQLTEKSDVYSYGMVMLVVISQSGLWSTMGDTAIGIRLKAFRLAQQGRQLELLAPRFTHVAAQDEASRFISVALLCVHPTTQLRPSMERVVQMLQGAMDIPPMSMPAIEAYVSAENQSLS